MMAGLSCHGRHVSEDSSCVGDSSSFVSLVLVVADSSNIFFDFSFLFSSTDSISRPASSFSFFCVLFACLLFKCVAVTTAVLLDSLPDELSTSILG